MWWSLATLARCSGLIELDTLILDYDAMNWSVYERETHLQAIPAFV